MENEEQEVWEPAELDHIVVQEVKVETEYREIQSEEEASSVLQGMKEEAEEVDIKPQFLRVCVKSEEGEPQSSLLHQTVTEEDRADTDAAGHSEDSEDTDHSEDWTPSAERSTQTQAELSEQLHGAAQTSNARGRKKVISHKCAFCGKVLQSKGALIEHERCHTGEKPFQCSVCDKRYRIKQHLKRHMVTHTVNPFKCTICSKDFTCRADKKKHVYEEHKRHTCSECGKGFQSYNYLVIHERSHTGERPFKCNVCEKAFKDRYHLHDHMRFHTGDKPFKCPVCSKSFFFNGDLKKHSMIHLEEKPFICPFCQRGFTQNHSLQSHIRIHTGETPYKCTDCEVSFTSMGSLKTHIENHKKKPFKCIICAQTFAVLDQLTTHLKLHMEEKTVA